MTAFASAYASAGIASSWARTSVCSRGGFPYLGQAPITQRYRFRIAEYSDGRKRAGSFDHFGRGKGHGQFCVVPGRERVLDHEIGNSINAETRVSRTVQDRTRHEFLTRPVPTPILPEPTRTALAGD